jgi:arginyl-tRNA synthetase
MIALSQVQFDMIYQRLGVKFDYTLGESFYHPRLQPLVQALRDKGIARESEGALAVFFEDIPQLKEHPALVQKSDGAFNYTTTDLATWRTGWRPGAPTRSSMSPMPASNSISSNSSPCSTDGSRTPR